MVHLFWFLKTYFNCGVVTLMSPYHFCKTIFNRQRKFRNRVEETRVQLNRSLVLISNVWFESSDGRQKDPLCLDIDQPKKKKTILKYIRVDTSLLSLRIIMIPSDRKQIMTSKVTISEIKKNLEAIKILQKSFKNFWKI